MGDADELKSYVEGLMRSAHGYAFLIVNVAGSEDFLQLTGDPTGVQIDFPVITPRQHELELDVRAAARTLGLPLVENRGSDGSRFLDIDLKEGDAARVAEVCLALLREVFGAGEGARLEFKGDGLA